MPVIVFSTERDASDNPVQIVFADADRVEITSNGGLLVYSSADATAQQRGGVALDRWSHYTVTPNVE